MGRDKNRHFMRGANDIFNVPLRSVPLIEMYGNRRVLIENHVGITSYSQNEIAIRVKCGAVNVLGDKLEILCMSKERIVLCGIICCVSLQGENE